MLITFEGIDGSGKSTQLRRLCDEPESKDAVFTAVSFPRYEAESAALVRQYLAGKFGGADSVNPYAAASFFAADRYAYFSAGQNSVFKSEKETGKDRLLIADRYNGSNAIYPGAKFHTDTEREAFFRWLEEYEYELLGLPRPDATLFFKIEPELALERIANRGGGADIHERDLDYFKRCAECAKHAARFYGWRVVDASRRENLVFDDVKLFIMSRFFQQTNL